MRFKALIARAKLPTLKNSLFAILSAILLVLAFPDFEFCFMAWFALVPLFYAVESERESVVKSFAVGWIFGVSFFFGACWWLTFAPINYGGVPAPIAYFLLLMACLVVGLFPAIFAALFSLLLKRFGSFAVFAAPALWVCLEFLRFWTTGNNWNAVGYVAAFSERKIIDLSGIGGVYLLSFYFLLWNAAIYYFIRVLIKNKKMLVPFFIVFLLIEISFYSIVAIYQPIVPTDKETSALVIAVQPNVPMSGLKYEDLERLRERHVQLAESVLENVRKLANDQQQPITVIFPESPMNFEYARDREFQQFLREFTIRNNVSVLFNAAEPAVGSGLYNAAVMVNERGLPIAQYNKIHLVPFGEYAPVPAPLSEIVPTMVGNFNFGSSYDLMPFGNAKAGIMICFESHFPNLSREFARQGADVLVELTNDGYLGKTPVLRQHLANAVFRAVETNRPVIRVTNVGITAYIDERGKIFDAAESYTEDTRVWEVKRSGAEPTLYVKYGDWFAWTCSIVSLILLILSFRKRKESNPLIS